MFFIKVLMVGAAPPFVFPRCLSAPDDFRLSSVAEAGRLASEGAALAGGGCPVWPGARRTGSGRALTGAFGRVIDH